MAPSGSAFVRSGMNQEQPRAGRKPGARSSVALAILGGLLLGMGGFTFLYAEGLSYLSADPRRA